MGNLEKWDFVPAHLRFKGLAAVKVRHGLRLFARPTFKPDAKSQGISQGDAPQAVVAFAK
jgi:hypothetical protein